jgi:hypothetical protein
MQVRKVLLQKQTGVEMNSEVVVLDDFTTQDVINHMEPHAEGFCDGIIENEREYILYRKTLDDDVYCFIMLH